MKKKPNYLRLVDILTLGGSALVVTGLALYASLATITTPHAKEGLALMWVVAALFTGIWGWFTWLRKKELDQFTWYPKHGFMVKAEGYLIPSQEAFDKSVEETIEIWSKHFPQTPQTINVGEAIWVWMSKSLNESPHVLPGKLVKGFAIPFTRTIVVDYDQPNDPWDKVPFKHELGHIIMGEATKDWTASNHHAFMAANGLP